MLWETSRTVKFVNEEFKFIRGVTVDMLLNEKFASCSDVNL